MAFDRMAKKNTAVGSGKRPRGRPKKLQGGWTNMKHGPLYNYLNSKLNEASARKSKAIHDAWLASQPKPVPTSAPMPAPTPAPIPTPAPTPVVGSGRRGRPKGSKNKK